MGALFKSSMLLALAIAIGVYLYLSLSDEDVISVPSEAPVDSIATAPVAPVSEATQADIDHELVDYLAARQIGLLEGWRAFLTAHGSGPHAQLARAEVEKLLHAEKTPASAIAEVSHGASPDGQAGSEAAPPAAPPAGTEVAALMLDEICKRDEERLERLRKSPSSEEAARFANELGCDKLRPQISRLAESLGYVAPTPISAAEGPSVKGGLAQGQKAEGDCAAERDRLDRLRAQPSADTAQQLWRDLRCERLRPQVRLLLESLNVAADPSGACRREAEELSRIRTNPNRRDAEGFARDMTCEALRPQAARLLESLTE
jgi:hypothetical protein